MKVARELLVDLFTGMGLEVAEKWGDKRMLTKIGALKTYLEDGTVTRDELSDEQSELLDQLLACDVSDITILLEPVAEEEAPAPKKKNKKAPKPAPEPEPEDEEEEEDDEEPEDEDEEEEEEDEEEPEEVPAPKKSSKKAKAEKSYTVVVGDYVHVKDGEGDEYDGQVTEVFPKNASVKDLATDEEWEVMDNCMTKLAKAPKVKKEKKPARPSDPAKKPVKKEKGKPGVIASILELLQKGTEKKPASKDSIIAELKTRFPERSEESMRATINVQIPSRISKEKGVTVKSNDKGYWIV